MGCGVSRAVAADPPPRNEVALLVRDARVEWKGGDYPDPYCVVRIGKSKSDFGDKPAESERVSRTVIDKFHPTWNFVATVPYIASEEVHIKVVDAHLFTWPVCQGSSVPTAGSPPADHSPLD